MSRQSLPNNCIENTAESATNVQEPMNFSREGVISRNRVKFYAANLRIKNMRTTRGVAASTPGCRL
jgi:hypothetical protein